MTIGILEINSYNIEERVSSYLMAVFDNLYSKETRLKEYFPYFKPQEELNKWLSFDQDTTKSKQFECIKLTHIELIIQLRGLVREQIINSFQFNDNEYIVQAYKYEIHLKVLYFGDIGLYAINKKTKNTGHHFRALRVETAINKLINFL